MYFFAITFDNNILNVKQMCKICMQGSTGTPKEELVRGMPHYCADSS